MGRIDAYSLASRGVIVDTSDVHASDADLLLAQNIQVDAVGGRGSIRRRDGLVPLNATALAGPVLGGIGVPLSDRTHRARVFYLALNDGINSWMTSPDGAVWTTVATPVRPVREATIGLDTGQAYGDSAMLWQGFGEALLYPGDDYSSAAGLALPSLHTWNGLEDLIVGYVPTNPLDLTNTSGPFGITSLTPFSDTQILIAVADRNSSGQGRSRVLLLDTRNGGWAQLGASAVLSAGHVVTGMVVWQRRVWIAGVNRTTGGALVTFWINPDPSDAEWTQDDSFGTQHGFCTGLAVFKGDLYQSSAAESGQSALIRRRIPSAAGSATATTAVSVGSSVVQGGSTQTQGAGSILQGGPSSLRVNTTLASFFISGQPTSIDVADVGAFPAGGGSALIGGSTQMFYTGRTGSSGPGSLTGVSWNGVNVSYGQGTPIKVNFPAGLSSLPVADTANFYSTGGAAIAGGQAITYTGLSMSSGAGELTGVSGLGSALTSFGSSTTFVSVSSVIASGATSLPIVETANFLAGGGFALVSGQTVAYTGRSTTSGFGFLTGVSGLSGAVNGGAQIIAVVPVGATVLPVVDTSAFGTAGSVTVGSNTVAYTGRSTTSGPGNLTGVSGVTTQILGGTAVSITFVAGTTSLPLVDTTNFLAAGTAIVAGQTITYTGRSTASGPGNLTGVTGILSTIAPGAAVVGGSIPIGSTTLPIADTSFFSAMGGSATAAGQAITYTGKSTTSGRGFLTGVSGITPAIANGATVSVTAPSVTVWTTVYTSTGTGANNYVGPLIVTADGAKMLAFHNSVSGGATPFVRIIGSVDGVVWATEYDVSANLSNAYGRSGMPLLDDNGDLYWPLASGSAGSATGGLLKRTAAGVWSIVLSGRTNIRGPLGILRT